jgi:hypothetical protein
VCEMAGGMHGRYWVVPLIELAARALEGSAGADVAVAVAVTRRRGLCAAFLSCRPSAVVSAVLTEHGREASWQLRYRLGLENSDMT